jgi:hypothetical protein
MPDFSGVFVSPDSVSRLLPTRDSGFWYSWFQTLFFQMQLVPLRLVRQRLKHDVPLSKICEELVGGPVQVEVS